MPYLPSNIFMYSKQETAIISKIKIYSFTASDGKTKGEHPVIIPSDTNRITETTFKGPYE